MCTRCAASCATARCAGCRRSPAGAALRVQALLPGCQGLYEHALCAVKACPCPRCLPEWPPALIAHSQEPQEMQVLCDRMIPQRMLVSRQRDIHGQAGDIWAAVRKRVRLEADIWGVPARTACCRRARAPPRWSACSAWASLPGRAGRPCSWPPPTAASVFTGAQPCPARAGQGRVWREAPGCQNPVAGGQGCTLHAQTRGPCGAGRLAARSQCRAALCWQCSLTME